MAEIGTTKYASGTIAAATGATTDYTDTIGNHTVIDFATGTPAANLVITLPATPDIGNAVSYTMTTADATYHVDFVASSINGTAYSSGGSYALIEAGDSVTFRYVDATVGWIVAANNFSKAYGSISLEGNTVATTVSNNSTDWSNKVIIDKFDTNGTSNAMTPAFGSNNLTIRRAGDYNLHASCSFSGTGNNVYSLAFFKNTGTTQVGKRTTRKLGSGGDTGACNVLSGAVTLAAGDTVELYCQNETSAGDFTIEDCTFSVIHVD